MDDKTILERITELHNEELELEEHKTSKSLTKDKLDRLGAIETELDQCWDLLRQRRARRSAGQDPDGATVRSEAVVENYLQ
ncbi:MAG: DUF2630 family protein [Actinomycetota bacterium]|nr:MAG: DUF2630 family protein [Actinomycetota bacterium]